MEWYVGQEVVIRNVNEHRRYWTDGQPPCGVVTKVGRKLVTVEDPYGNPKTYYIEDGQANDKWGHAWIQTKEAFAAQERRTELVHALRKTGLFDAYYPKLHTDTLEAILQVITVMEADHEIDIVP